MEYYIKEHGIIYQKTPNAIKHLDCNECAYGKKHIGGIYCSLFQASKCENGYHYKIKDNNMKKSELCFKCVLGSKTRNKQMYDALIKAGLRNSINDQDFISTAMCLWVDDQWFDEVSPTYSNIISDSYENNPSPEITFSEALKLLGEAEPDAPEFDIKPFDRVLLRDMNGEWSADFYNKIYSACEFDFVACQADHMIKYEGNEQYHGTKDTPAGWWECENGKPVWRTK